MRRLLLSISLLSFASSSAFAQEWMVPPAGIAATKVNVGRATVSLPPGNWQELSSFEGSASSLGNSASAQTKLFVAYDKGSISGVVVIISNKAAELSYRTPDRCMRKDTVISDIQSLDKSKWSCIQINHTVTEDPSKAVGVYPALYDAARVHGGIPNVWLTSTIDLAGQTQYDFLEVIVYRDPRRDGFNDSKSTWALSDWHRSNITPDRMAVAQKMLTWSQAYRTTLLHDYRGE